MFKQNTPYGVNFKKEFKEYKKACKGKGSYRNYLNWRNHILDILDGMDIKTLENFRRFCLYTENTEKYGITVFLTMIAIFIPVYITNLFNTDGKQLAALVAYGIIAGFVTFFVTLSYFSYTLSKDFYRDIAEIAQAKIDSMPEKHLLLIETKKENSEVLK